MKILFICLLFMTYLNADEMTRIDAIVSDITDLRVDYAKCQKELSLKKDSSTQQDLQKQIYDLQRVVKELKLKLKIKKNNDAFPKLIMKDKFVNNNDIIKFKAASFRLKYESIVYDGIDGNMIDKWDVLTSFTANTKTKSWIKISGYFVNKKWTPAKKEMWVKIQQVEKK